VKPQKLIMTYGVNRCWVFSTFNVIIIDIKTHKAANRYNKSIHKTYML